MARQVHRDAENAGGQRKRFIAMMNTSVIVVGSYQFVRDRKRTDRVYLAGWEKSSKRESRRTRRGRKSSLRARRAVLALLVYDTKYRSLFHEKLNPGNLGRQVEKLRARPVKNGVRKSLAPQPG